MLFCDVTYRQYRRECLRQLKSPLVDELDYMDQFAQENPKNYQIWHHRRATVIDLRAIGALSDEVLGKRELEFTEAVFEEDAKNYHAWAHRQWTIKEFNLWEIELPFINKCIEEDIRNNSAWNQVRDTTSKQHRHANHLLHLFAYSVGLQSTHVLIQ